MYRVSCRQGCFTDFGGRYDRGTVRSKKKTSTVSRLCIHEGPSSAHVSLVHSFLQRCQKFKRIYFGMYSNENKIKFQLGISIMADFLFVITYFLNFFNVTGLNFNCSRIICFILHMCNHNKILRRVLMILHILQGSHHSTI